MAPAQADRQGSADRDDLVLGVRAWGYHETDTADLARLRQQLNQAGADAWPSSLLKNADGQTLVGLAAVVQAAEKHSIDVKATSGWGIVSAPRKLGRETMVETLLAFQEEGAFGVLPHVIPNHSLHSISGAISIALRIHGPNLGVGQPDEALLVAADWLESEQASGVWVVGTWVDSANRALALVLSAPASSTCACVRVKKPNTRNPSQPFDLNQLRDWLAGESPQSLRQHLGASGVLEWHRETGSRSLSSHHAA